MPVGNVPVPNVPVQGTKTKLMIQNLQLDAVQTAQRDFIIQRVMLSTKQNKKMGIVRERTTREKKQLDEQSSQKLSSRKAEGFVGTRVKKTGYEAEQRSP